MPRPQLSRPTSTLAPPPPTQSHYFVSRHSPTHPHPFPSPPPALASQWSHLAHPYIATVVAYATDERYCYLTTELYGCDLTDRINSADDEYLREDEAATYFTQILEALRHCHRQGVFHRDLKPDNILIDIATNDAKLTDFGSALVVDAHDAASVGSEPPMMMATDDSDTHLPLTAPSPGRDSAADAGSLSYSAPEVLGIRDEDSDMPKGLDNEGTHTTRVRRSWAGFAIRSG